MLNCVGLAMTTCKAVNVWPIRPPHHANENSFPTDLETDLLLIEYKASRILAMTEALAADIERLKEKWGLS